MGDDVFRVLPRLGRTNRHFWTGGEHGELRILRCQACGFYIHPGGPRCPACLATDVAPEAVSGDGTVYTFTVNHQEWNPTYEHPYVVALVELAEQSGLRLITNVVGCAPEDVEIGMPVTVEFEQDEDVWLPMFRPRADS